MCVCHILWILGFNTFPQLNQYCNTASAWLYISLTCLQCLILFSQKNYQDTVNLVLVFNVVFARWIASWLTLLLSIQRDVIISITRVSKFYSRILWYPLTDFFIHMNKIEFYLWIEFLIFIQVNINVHRNQNFVISEY